MVPVAGDGRLRQLLDAVMSLGSEVGLHPTLERVVTAAMGLTDADYGAFGVLNPTGTELAELLAVGVDEATREKIGADPVGRGVLGVLIGNPVPLRLASIEDHPDSIGLPDGHPPVHSFLGVPVKVRNRVFGFVYLADKRGADGFDLDDEQLTVALATAAGTAIENAAMHDRFAEVVVIEERERIARELHDVVIQRLYGVGLNIQGCVGLSGDPKLTSRLEAAVGDLDDTIGDIRTTIFELQAARTERGSLRRAVLDLVAEASRALGFEPTVRFDGPVDTSISAATAEHLLIVLREALSNIARHAQATRAELTVSTDAELVVLTVADDGVGPTRPDLDAAHGPSVTPTGQGLRNIATRAERLGGSSTFAPGPSGGSILEWTVPLSWI